ncbi:MAG: glycosyltransferase family 8 protein [Schleiferiaceae bacterium]
MSTAICFVVDPNYAPYALAQAIQVIKLVPDIPVHVFIEGRPETFTLPVPKKISVHWNELSPYVPDGLPESSKWSKIVYCRMFLPQVLGADRIIYFDADIAIVSEIDALLNTPFGNKGLFAAHDSGLVGPIAPGLRISSQKWLRQIGLRNSRYFNSGVLVMNSAAWREIDFSSALVKYFSDYGEYARMWDQDFLNFKFQGRWGELSPCYNYQLSLFGFGFESIFDPAVVHFTDGTKPWHQGFTWSDKIVSYFDRKLGEAGLENLAPAQRRAEIQFKTKFRLLAYKLGLRCGRASRQKERWTTLRAQYLEFYKSTIASNLFVDRVKNAPAIAKPFADGTFDGRWYRAPFPEQFLLKFEK